ncbi:MAG: hypothetical protein IMW98_03500 [Firmicutes bacterium]|nr:hypothetical protein [Bacillota bacterium]
MPGENLAALAEYEAAERDKKPQAQVLVELAEAVELWHAPDSEAFATFLEGRHIETWPLRSKGFRQWLIGRFYGAQGRPPSAQALQDALGVLEARAMFGGREYAVFVRIGALGDRVFLDLCDDEWRAVEVNANGWHVTTAPPVKLRRTRGMLALPQPAKGGRIEELRPFLNVTDEQWPLVVAWLVAALHPSGPYPVLCLQGEQGSAKSTTARVLRSLVDPNAAPLRTMPRDERDLFIAATNSWCVVLDNVSGLAPWLSDGLCRLATGGGFATRTLYENAEETILAATRPVILNGIDDVATRQDLLDRALILNLPTIPDECRRDEASFWREWEKARPRVLAGLLDAVSCALRNVDRVRLDRMPRMADFAKWVVAAEPALPWPAGAFMDAYAGNRADAVELALEADPVAQAVRQAAERGEWTGTASELLDELEQIAPEKVQHSRTWPTTARTLANRLRRAATFLRALGVEVEFYREGHDRRRMVAVRKIEQPIVRNVREDATEAANPSATRVSPADDDADDVRTQTSYADANEALSSAPIVRTETQVRQGIPAFADAEDDADDDLPLSSLGRDVPPGDPAWSGAPWREGGA